MRQMILLYGRWSYYKAGPCTHTIQCSGKYSPDESDHTKSLFVVYCNEFVFTWGISGSSCRPVTIVFVRDWVTLVKCVTSTHGGWKYRDFFWYLTLFHTTPYMLCNGTNGQRGVSCKRGFNPINYYTPTICWLRQYKIHVWVDHAVYGWNDSEITGNPSVFNYLKPCKITISVITSIIYNVYIHRHQGYTEDI